MRPVATYSCARPRAAGGELRIDGERRTERILCCRIVPLRDADGSEQGVIKGFLCVSLQQRARHLGSFVGVFRTQLAQYEGRTGNGRPALGRKYVLERR